MSTGAAIVVGAVAGLALGILVSTTTDVPLAPEIGGGFGGKNTLVMEPPAGLLSRKTGKPVKMIMDREEVVSGWNPSATRLFGYEPEEAIGNHIDDLCWQEGSYGLKKLLRLDERDVGHDPVHAHPEHAVVEVRHHARVVRDDPDDLT